MLNNIFSEEQTFKETESSREKKKNLCDKKILLFKKA